MTLSQTTISQKEKSVLLKKVKKVIFLKKSRKKEVCCFLLRHTETRNQAQSRVFFRFAYWYLTLCLNLHFQEFISRILQGKELKKLFSCANMLQVVMTGAESSVIFKCVLLAMARSMLPLLNPASSYCTWIQRVSWVFKLILYPVINGLMHQWLRNFKHNLLIEICHWG